VPFGTEWHAKGRGEIRLGRAATDFEGGTSGIKVRSDGDAQQFVVQRILQEKVRKPTA
jgi:hypothetical protein